VSQLATSGFEELAKKFRKLEMKTQDKLTTQVPRFAMTPVRDAGRSNGPKGIRGHFVARKRVSKAHGAARTGGIYVPPGYGARSIDIDVKRWSNKAGATVSVGPSSNAFYLTQFVEIGTGKQPRQDWLLKTYRQTKSQVEKRFADRMGQKIEQLAGNSSK